MFRLILLQAKKPKPKSIDLSAAFSSISRAKDSIHCRILRELNSGDGKILSNFCWSIFEQRTGKFPHKTSNPLIVIDSLFNRKYATDATIETSIRSDKLPQADLVDIINELNTKCIADGNRLSQHELKILFNRIKTQKPTAEQALNILKLCSLGRTDANVTEIVKSIWHELHSVDIMSAHEFDTQHYNFMLKFASERRDVNHTQTIFDQMIADGNEPNATSYEHLLSVYCKSGNMEKTKEILHMMDQSQLPLSECSYNYMIQCYIISGAVTDANKMIEHINTEKSDEQRFKINRDTLTTVLRHYAKACDLENCRKTLLMFKSLNIELLNQDVFYVMCQFCINGTADQCSSLVEYFKPSPEMQSALRYAITTFVQHKHSQHFVDIFEKLIDDGIVSDVKPTIYKRLIHEMCRHNTPVDEFEATIESIESIGFPMEKNFDSFKPALKSSSPKLIRRLLSHMKTNRLQVSEMAFEKLFELATTTSTTAALREDSILNIVKSMCVDFDIQPSVTYIRDVIAPALLNTNANANEDSLSVMSAADKLLNTKIVYYRTLNALINRSLNRCDFKTAIQLMNIKRCFHGIPFITKPLLNAYTQTGDAQNFVKILEIIGQNYSKIVDYHPQKLSNDEVKLRKTAFIDEMLTSAVAHSLVDANRLSKLLNAFAQANDELAINSTQITKMEQQISESKDLSPRAKEQHMMQINRLLKSSLPTTKGRRSSLTETFKPITTVATTQNRQKSNISDHLSAAEIKQRLNEQHTSGRDVTGTEKQLFLAYIREDNISEVEAMLAGKTTVTGELNLTQANYAMLIKMYTRTGDLDKAMNMMELARQKDSTFKINPIELAQLIALMYERGRFNVKEIDALLHMHRQEKMIVNRNVPFQQLLQRLSANGQTQEVQQLFDTLVKFHYIQPTLESVGPLITVHLTNGEYGLAVQKYNEIGATYKFLPMSGTLFETLIQNEQNELIQRAFEIDEKFLGKSAAMSHLAFAYSECGQIEKAKEIFQSGQINDLTRDIGKKCVYYVQRDNLKTAKFLLKSTEGILTCDRRPIYQIILDYYCKFDMADAALELWFTISNDDVLPTPQFLNKLAKLLESNHIELPSDLENKIKRRNC